MCLRWNWHDKALESTCCSFFINVILAHVINDQFLPNDAGPKSLVCTAHILTRAHSPLYMGTRQQAQTWSRGAFSLHIWAYYYLSMSKCSTKVEHLRACLALCHAPSYTLTQWRGVVACSGAPPIRKCIEEHLNHQRRTYLGHRPPILGLDLVIFLNIIYLAGPNGKKQGFGVKRDP